MKNTNKNKGHKELTMAILILIFAILFSASMIYIVMLLEGYWGANQEYDDIRDHMGTVELTTEEESEENTFVSEENQEETKETNEILEETETESEETTEDYYQSVKDKLEANKENQEKQTQAQKPKTQPTTLTAPDFGYLHSINDSVIGWIQIPGTPIDYPIVQGTDNDYYLTHTISGEESRSGAIFLDSKLEHGLDDKNPIIYGHNLKSGKMFSRLNRYTRQSFWNTYRYVYITRLNGVVEKYFVFSAYQTSSDILLKYGFDDNDAFVNYCNELIARSCFHADVSIAANDKIITLVTCANNVEDRFIVHALRVQ